jgi:hypothetical protein
MLVVSPMTCPSCQAVNAPGVESCFTCGAQLSPPVRKGTIFGGRYEVMSPIGRGGMGTVYRARDRVLGDKVALKVMRADLSSKPEMIGRFGSEMALARKVRHPNVCRIFASGDEDGRLWMCMELVEGTEMKALVRPNGLDAERAFEWATQLANGLQALHEVGLVHRDVKAQNVMIDGKGLAKVMDLDIAKHMEAAGAGGVTATATGQQLGTPEYMSPEHARGEPVDARSDVYSLGVLVFEMFTGELPFKGDSPVATIMKHQREAPPLEGPRAERLPPQVVPVLRKALSKQAERRYSTARGMAVALGVARTAAHSLPLPPPGAANEPLPALLEALNPLDKTIRMAPPRKVDPAAPKAIPVLVHALAGPQPTADETLPPPAAVPLDAEPLAVLIDALKAENKHDRARAARALGGLGAEARVAIPVLLESLRDREAIVRYDAAKALEKMGDAARDALASALQDDDEVVRRIASEALARIIRRKRDRR